MLSTLLLPGQETVAVPAPATRPTEARLPKEEPRNAGWGWLFAVVGAIVSVFLVLLSWTFEASDSVSGAGSSDEVESAKTKTPPKDDRKARAAVVKYETRQGRRAEEMPPGQPGFDVLSYDPVGPQRRIEVKGVKGVFEEDASVLLTARQVQDALQHEDYDVEYWLYVVDRTETDDPQVYPIQWTRNRRQLRYGFYADMWAECAERDGDTPKG